jgi:HEAT repeat protein
LHGASVTLAVVLAVVSSAAFAQDVAALGARLKAVDPIERTKAACQISDLGTTAKALIPQLVAVLGDAAAVPGDTCGDRGRSWKGRGADGRVPETTPGERAAEALVSIGTAAFDPIVQALRGPLWHARKNAAWALGALDDRRAVEPLIAALGDASPVVQEQVSWALGVIGDDVAVEPLASVLPGLGDEAREQAAWALGALGDRRGIDALGLALRDPVAAVREQAAWALGAIGDPSAAPALRAVLGDRDGDVRSQVRWALSVLEGKR